MTTDRTKTEHSKQSEQARPGMIDTMIHLGTATTNLAIDQVGNALTALVHPNKAMDHVKDTLKNLSDAMNNSAAGHSEGRQRSDLRGASDGMEHVSTEHVQTPVAEGRRASGTQGTRVRVQSKMNHRKT